MLRRFREERREAVRQYVGNHWSDEGTLEKVPVNLLALYVSVVGRSLIAKNPRVLLSTFDRQQKPAVAAMRRWVNEEVERMRLANTLQRVVVDGLFSVGIAKVALATPADAASVAWTLRAGEPYCERVDLDDWVYDIHARDFLEAGFMGHRIRVPLEVVRDSKIYSKWRKTLSPSEDKIYNEQGDERISVLGRGMYGSNSEEFEDFVDLWEVYVPRHRLVFTLSDDQVSGGAGVGAGGTNEPLRVQSWLGPDSGPYHLLGFGTVPGNAMPKGPIQDLVDLHEDHNRAMRKLIRAIERLKELTLVQGSDSEDGERLRKANDGDMVPVINPQNVNQVVMGGNHVQVLLAVATELKRLFNLVGGNLELMGGRGPQADTAHQEELLNQNAGMGVADMQDRTVSFTAEVMQALCWYWWYHPTKVMQTSHSLPGLPQMGQTLNLYPGSHQDQRKLRRAGSFPSIKVEPYSMRHSTPESRMASLDQLMKEIIIPLAPFLAQQGIMADMNAYLGLKSEYTDTPEIAEVLTIRQPLGDGAGGTGGGMDAPKMPGNTSREYVRKSVSEQSGEGHDQQMVASMLGHDLGGAPKNGQAKM